MSSIAVSPALMCGKSQNHALLKNASICNIVNFIFMKRICSQVNIKNLIRGDTPYVIQLFNKYWKKISITPSKRR